MADWPINNELTEELKVDEDKFTFDAELYDSDWLLVTSPASKNWG